MNNLKRLSVLAMMLTLVLCFTVAFASCGYVDEPTEPAGCAHADTDNDHKCNTCGETISECSNNNKDHKCDICGKTLGGCADNDSDHYCDVCDAELSNCEIDVNPVDHKCDICGEILGACADNLGNDHKCDHCQAEMSKCADNNNDHLCDVCRAEQSKCSDSDDDDHKCDLCGDVMCYDDDGDGYCDESTCGDPICYDYNNDCVCDDCEDPMHVDSNGDHVCEKCNTTVSQCSDVTTDTDHLCDVCQKSLCTDTDGNYVCDDENCQAALARITAYIPSPMCYSWSGTKVVAVYDEGGKISFTPVYKGGTYVIDFWAVYDSTGAVFAYVENGSKFETTTEGVYTVLPVFIANNTTGVSDNDLTLDLSTLDHAKITNDCLLPSWADVDTSKKLIKVTSGGNVVSANPGAAIYTTMDPTDAANAILLVAVNNYNTGSIGCVSIAAEVDEASKGNTIVVSFDYQLEYLYSQSGITTMIYLSDSEGNSFCLARLLTGYGKNIFPATSNTSTPVESAFYIKTQTTSATPATKADGTGSQALSSDTWYTITFEIDTESDTVTTYYSLRGAATRTVVGEESISTDLDPSKITSLNIEMGHYANRQISFFDNISAARVHDCVDDNGDHACDTCSAKLCADGDDEDHKCDTCQISMCYEGDIPDHICDGCGASTECVDENTDHLCDICLTRKFGGDSGACADSDDADHNCDYCGASMCYDLTNDHKCDECTATISECADEDEDHKCDVCGVELSKCTDADGDMDHLCDYKGCKAEDITTCSDGTDEGHRCDECNKTLCVDTDTNGTCDGCGQHVCIDTDTNGICDGCSATTFNVDITTGVSVYSFTGTNNADAAQQTSITTADPYDADTANKYGVTLFRTANPEDASDTVLKMVVNQNDKPGCGGSSTYPSYVTFAPSSTVSEGGIYHVFEFDFYLESYAKNANENIFRLVALDSDGAYTVVEHSNASYGSTVSMHTSVNGPTKNAVTFGAPAQANEISSQCNLDSHTWYRIRITFNQTTGAIYYDVTFNGTDWYLLQNDGKNLGTGLSGKTIERVGFTFNYYNLGGTVLIDNVKYTVTDTIADRTNMVLGTDEIEHPTAE